MLARYIKITRPQLEEAKVHLFGAIQHSTKKSNTVKNTSINTVRRQMESKSGLIKLLLRIMMGIDRLEKLG